MEEDLDGEPKGENVDLPDTNRQEEPRETEDAGKTAEEGDEAANANL